LQARQGKKVTARQRKKLQSDVEAQQRDAASERAEEAAHREGAQFACSQSAVSDADQTWQNALDITIAAFSISAMDKTLFKDSPLQVSVTAYVHVHIDVDSVAHTLVVVVSCEL
jgi:ATP-binding cassette, subfamily F, member 1